MLIDLAICVYVCKNIYLMLFADCLSRQFTVCRINILNYISIDVFPTRDICAIYLIAMI